MILSTFIQYSSTPASCSINMLVWLLSLPSDRSKRRDNTHSGQSCGTKRVPGRPKIAWNYKREEPCCK